jgi:hypothetical protein
MAIDFGYPIIFTHLLALEIDLSPLARSEPAGKA